jgi:hypothetical protein
MPKPTNSAPSKVHRIMAEVNFNTFVRDVEPKRSVMTPLTFGLGLEAIDGKCLL